MIEKFERILEWLKAIVTKLFHKPTKVSVKPEASLSKERPEMATPIRWGHNMPKYQPCPFGHGWKKRIEKTMSGADYWCNVCRTRFLVRTV